MKKILVIKLLTILIISSCKISYTNKIKFYNTTDYDLLKLVYNGSEGRDSIYLGSNDTSDVISVRTANAFLLAEGGLGLGVREFSHSSIDSTIIRTNYYGYFYTNSQLYKNHINKIIIDVKKKNTEKPINSIFQFHIRR